MIVLVDDAEPITLGETEAAPTVGIIDYSRRVTDDFGVTTVVQRGFSRRMSVRLALPTDAADGVQRSLATLRATAAQWVADDRFAWLSPMGYYKDFEVDLAVPPLSFCTLSVEGLAETDSVPDAGEDPAPDGAESTFRMLRPLAVTDALLATSTVPEDDEPAWSAGTTYPLGVRVIRAGTHRIYESLIAGNIGHTPESSPTYWLDVGPTNRWAMFDEALGTATGAATGPMVVTFSVAGIGALALLDATCDSVRVEVIHASATVYDQTRAADGGSLKFLDLPVVDGTVRVTIAGDGAISVGTLLIGDIVGLGLTEASPTAGITDFSRKQVDDFGEVTIVQRGWAKRMTAKALIDTEALDIVADRIAAVRARPVLWIGDGDIDSLTIFGFFRDFSIEVGETVSKLSLSIEGLSKATPLAPLIDLSGLNLRIDEVEADLARTVSNGYLDRGEKPKTYLDHAALQSTISSLNDRYIALLGPSDIASFHDDANAKFAALTDNLAALVPDWTDDTQDTPIIAAAYRSWWVDAYEAAAIFQSSMAGRIITTPPNQFANSAFRFGSSQWGKPWAGEVGNGVLTWADGKLLLSSPAPAPGADAGFCSVSAYDGGSMLGGWHLFQVRPGQRIAVRARGSISRANAHFFGVFRFYDNTSSAPIVDLLGTAFAGYSRDLWQDSQEAAYYVDVPAGAKWLWIEFYGNSVSSGDSVEISLESMLFAYIDPAQTIPPVWNEGPTGAYRADVTGENTALDTQYVGGVAVSTVLSNIDAALYDAANAQATADGKVDTFYQPSPPAGSLGDLWFDTDDGNKLYRHDGSGWAVSQDAAIGAAITAAAGAQATADGKVTTFIGASAPTPTGIGDLWSNSTTHVLYRWSGSAWQEVAKLGADGVSALTITTQPGAVTVPCTANGTPKGAIPGFSIAVSQGSTDATASAGYGAPVSSGLTGTIAVSSAGVVSGITGMSADSGYVEVAIDYNGAIGKARVSYTKVNEAPAYARNMDNTITVPGSGYGEVARTALLCGPNGTIRSDYNINGTVTGGGSAGMDGYQEVSLNGTTWSAVSTISGASWSNMHDSNQPPGEVPGAYGTTSFTGSAIGLSAQQTIYVRLMAQKNGAGGLSGMTGSLDTQWSG